MPAVDIWNICNTHVVPHYGRPAKARADLNSLAVYGQNLTVNINGVPHQRHGNIEGWDFTTGTRLQCLKLAAAAGKLKIPPA